MARFFLAVGRVARWRSCLFLRAPEIKKIIKIKGSALQLPSQVAAGSWLGKRPSYVRNHFVRIAEEFP